MEANLFALVIIKGDSMIFNINELSFQEKILFSTVRIVTDKGMGTGFFFNFKFMMELRPA